MNEFKLSIKNSRPKNVTLAIQLLYISMVISFINLLFTIKKYDSVIVMSIVISTLIIALILIVLFISLIGKRKNWVRIVYSVIRILGFPMLIENIIKNIQIHPNYIMSLISLCLDVTAIILLFTKTANLWFKGEKNKNENTENS
jgi:cellulose synthase/poly-beta-1,6-N-acetylglucosamine synthase-like glycosyltransferase